MLCLSRKSCIRVILVDAKLEKDRDAARMVEKRITNELEGTLS